MAASNPVWVIPLLVVACSFDSSGAGLGIGLGVAGDTTGGDPVESGSSSDSTLPSTGASSVGTGSTGSEPGTSTGPVSGTGGGPPDGSGEDGRDSTNEESSDDGEELDRWAACPSGTDAECPFDDEVCVTIAGQFSWCGAQPCSHGGDCPGTTSGTAMPICIVHDGGTCALSCEGGLTCPTGMDCALIQTATQAFYRCVWW